MGNFRHFVGATADSMGHLWMGAPKVNASQTVSNAPTAEDAVARTIGLQQTGHCERRLLWEAHMKQRYADASSTARVCSG